MLDGAWGTLIHGADLQPGRLPRRALRRPPGRRHPQPRPAQPDPAGPLASVHERYFAAGADITTTNTFTATSIGQADYGARAVRLRDEPRRARGSPARPPATASSPARSGRSTSPSRSARRSTTPASGRTRFDQVKEAYAEQMRALAEGGVDLLLLETDLRHAEREGGDRRRARGTRPSCRSGSRRRSSTSPGGRSRARRSRRSGPRSRTPSR